MTTLDNIHGQKGFVTYGQYGPDEPYWIDDGIVIVPGGIDAKYGCRSYFIPPANWSEADAKVRFRDWIVFDCFVMRSNAPHLYDQGNVLLFEDVKFSVDKSPSGESYMDGRQNFSDITRFLIEEFHKPDDLPAIPYSELYSRYRALPKKLKNILEGYVSRPPSPKAIDGFYGYYWPILHMTIVLESIIGNPPSCKSPFPACVDCGTPPRSHYSSKRSDWLRQQLGRRVPDTALVEKYASLVETAVETRNKMSHGPYFSRAILPQMRYHGQTFEYDMQKATELYLSDWVALTAIHYGLSSLVHALIVADAFGINHFAPRTLKTTRMDRSGPVGGPYD